MFRYLMAGFLHGRSHSGLRIPPRSTDSTKVNNVRTSVNVPPKFCRFLHMPYHQIVRRGPQRPYYPAYVQFTELIVEMQIAASLPISRPLCIPLWLSLRYLSKPDPIPPCSSVESLDWLSPDYCSRTAPVRCLLGSGTGPDCQRKA